MNHLTKIVETSIVEQTRAVLAEAYVADARPWVVAYSGGKDSTLVLQLVVEMLKDFGEAATKPVYVISSDTQVEAPNVVAYIKNTLQAIEESGQRQSLPIHTKMVRPEVSETFWSKIIGKGYPPPTRWFRWCTTNMKIKPSRRAIDKIVEANGSVILLLGSRLAESSLRRRTMSGRTTNARDLNPHHEIPNAFVMTPISDWEDDEVWEYLFENNPPPWGRPHDQMLTLYRKAVGGECPVVVDLSTPSCGGSRFGCWTCTVVKADKSMDGFIDSGEDWMRPLAEFRNWIKIYRERDDVRMKRKRDGREGPGPFTPEARIEILERVLSAEAEVGMRLISDDELAHIHNIWTSEFDLEGQALKIATRFGRYLQEVCDMPLSKDEMNLLEETVVEYGLNPHLVDRIMSLEPEFPNLDRYGEKPRLKNSLSEIISVAASQEVMGQ